MNLPTSDSSRNYQGPGQDHHRTVSQAERESYARGILPLGNELPGGVVDRGDVVPVVAVLDAGQIGREHQSKRQRLSRRRRPGNQERDGGKVHDAHRTKGGQQARPERQLLTLAVHGGELGQGSHQYFLRFRGAWPYQR
jgi:hypothetical protein